MVQLLDYVLGVGLGVAMHCREVYLLALSNLAISMFYQHALTTSFRTYNYEVLIVIHPLSDSIKVRLGHNSF